MLELEKVEELTELYRKHISGELSDTDNILLDEKLIGLPYIKRMFDEAANEETFYKMVFAYYNQAEEITDEEVQRQFKKSLGEEKVVPMRERKISWLRYAAAAVLFVMVGLAVYLWQRSEKQPALVNAPQEKRFKNEVPAATNGAVLILSDNQQIKLDDASDGLLAVDGNVRIVKKGGKIIYEAVNGNNTEILYNTVSTARGKFMSFSLSDGSVVTLNAASKINYPIQFSGIERRVRAEGEVYFSVAKNPKLPFIVESRGMSIEVTGTEFNLNSYDGDNEIITTLVEGSVHVKKGDNILKLMPGQQAVTKQNTADSEIRLVKDANVQKEIAWKEGLFHYENTPIEEIMKQISLWYDVDVTFDAKLNKQYYFTISRNEPLSRLLKIMEKTGNVRFIIDGKKISVIK